MKDFKKLIKEAHLGNPLNEAEAKINELDSLEDPVMAKLRRRQMQDDKEKAKQAHLDRKYGKSFMDKLDAELDLKGELEDLKQEREMIMIDMEEEAEPEGGPIADRYGERLNQIDMRIADIQEELDDLRMYESVNEDKYLKNQDSYIRVTEPRFSKDKNSPNFLFGRINYDTGPGVGTALGKETMAGQIRRLSSMEAMRRMKSIAVQLEDAFDLEDIEVTDLENGTVELFAVSDDFIDIDPKSELSTAMLNEDLIKEITLDGGNYQDSYGNNPADDQLTTTEDYEIFMEMFPRGEASRILMDPKRKELYDKHLEWTKEYDGNFTFEHMQYHLINHDGEDYKVHQSQYYNSNYKDFRNPSFTELTISKDGKRMGTYLVDTEEYIKDLENLEVKNKLSESLNEGFKVGDKVTYLGHPGVITYVEKDPIGREFVSISYDKGNGKTKVRMILSKSPVVKAVEEGTCGYGKNGKIGDKPAGPDLNEMEDSIPAFMMRDGMYRELIDDSVNYNDFEKRIYGFVGPKFYKTIHSEYPGALKDFYDKFRMEEDIETSLTPNEIGDEAVERESASGAYESKTFDFKKMIKEALTPDYLKK